MKLIGHYKRSDLVILNFTTAAHRVGDPDSYEDVLLADRPSAPDTDGTTRGQTRDGWGWCCLVLREDLSRWIAAGRVAGYDVEVIEEPEPGHYGDGHWAGVDLARDPRSENHVYWIDRDAS